MSPVAWYSLGAWALVVAAAAVLRSRAYAVYRGITLGLHILIFVPLFPFFGPLRPLALVLHGLVFVQSLALIRPRLRPLWYRAAISWPGQYFAASILLAFPWAIAASLGWTPYGKELPFALGLVGLIQSLTRKRESRRVTVGEVPALPRVQRVLEPRSLPIPPEGKEGAVQSLRIVQITDPHLGPWMSIAQLRAICERAVAEDPDLVALTGDFLTMESQNGPEPLAEALAPLRTLSGRTWACLGNHDHEAPTAVREALASAGVRLLVDEAAIVSTRLGQVQVLGFDFHFRKRAEKMKAVCERFPRQGKMRRIALLHDPGAFRHLPDGEADLVLSGHTHGGQVGLVSLGFLWTIAGAVTNIPDHGFWGMGKNRLYVHRGTGHYGFPLRLGVPAEESVLHVQFCGT